MVALLEKVIRREGIGDVLADGVKAAAAKIGRGAEACAMHVGGQEPGLHSALFLPSRGTGFVCDPTPGRHTAAPMARIEGGPGAYAPYPELKIGAFERHAYTGKGPMSATASCYLQVGNCAGVCVMPFMFFGNYPLVDLLKAVTGWDLDVAEALRTGARIQTLRQSFNLREGVTAGQVRLPDRMTGRPPQAARAARRRDRRRGQPRPRLPHGHGLGRRDRRTDRGYVEGVGFEELVTELVKRFG